MHALTRIGGVPLRVFVASRAAIWALAAGTLLLFGEHLDPERVRWDSPRLHDLGGAIDVWARWDSDWYLRIAASWYDWPSSGPAFFPLYPSLVGGLGRVLGGHEILAGVLVSTACGAAAFALLHGLVRDRLGEDVAGRTVVLLALFPTSFFFTAVYSESLFLLLAVGVFVLAERGRLAEASLVAGLALLTRSQGAALLPVLALFAWRSAPRARSLALVAVPLAVFAVYPVLLAVSIGHPFAFVTAQREVWGRSFDPLGGARGVASAVGDGHLLEVASAALMLPLAVAAWRRLGAAYGSYAVGVLALPLAFPSSRFGALYSFPRLCLAAFPCVVALALLTRRPAVWWPTVVTCSVVLAVLVVRWSLWEWVA